MLVFNFFNDCAEKKLTLTLLARASGGQLCFVFQFAKHL